MRTRFAARPAPYPVMLDLAGRSVLVVGGGGVAARKAGAVLDAGARLRVVAPTLSAPLRRLHEEGRLAWAARAAAPGDTAGCILVICATGVASADAEVAAEARAACIPVVVCAEHEAGTAAVPASVRRGRLVVSISTGGTSPSFAAFVRRRLEPRLGPELADLADLAERMRRLGREAGIGPEQRDRIAAAAFPRLLGLLEEGRREDAAALADELAVTPVPSADGERQEPMTPWT